MSKESEHRRRSHTTATRNTMTEFARATGFTATATADTSVPNASYDSAIDSLLDECNGNSHEPSEASSSSSTSSSSSSSSFSSSSSSSSASPSPPTLASVAARRAEFSLTTATTGHLALSSSVTGAAVAPSSPVHRRPKSTKIANKSECPPSALPLLDGQILYNYSKNDTNNLNSRSPLAPRRPATVINVVRTYLTPPDVGERHSSPICTEKRQSQPVLSIKRQPQISRCSSNKSINKSVSSSNKTSMALFLDRIDASSSSMLTITNYGQATDSFNSACQIIQSKTKDDNSSRSTCATAISSNNRSSNCAAATSHSAEADSRAKLAASTASVCHSGRDRCRPQPMPPKQQQKQHQRVCIKAAPKVTTVNDAKALSATSSSLRSSRSFTINYRQRPNVTLIRRKSASERLAESRSKYIRSDLDHYDGVSGRVDDNDDGDDDVAVCENLIESSSSENTASLDTHSYQNCSNRNESCAARFAIAEEKFGGDIDATLAPERSVRRMVVTTPSCGTGKLNRSTPNSSADHTTSPTTARLSPYSDIAVHEAEKQTRGNLVDRINCQLSKSKSNQNYSCSKKRDSPRNLDGSIMTHAMSSLELQLRELITLDTSTNETMLLSNEPTTQSPAVRQTDAPNIDQQTHGNAANETEHIYRAELKYIASSSSSSLSSMYSETNDPASTLPPPNLRQHSMSEKHSVAPSIEQRMDQLFSNVVRSKSDVSPKRELPDKYHLPHDNTDRLFGSLAIDSDAYSHSPHSPQRSRSDGRSVACELSRSSNLHNYFTASSESMDKNAIPKHVAIKRAMSPTNCMTAIGAKSSSINELSSLNSSQLSVADHIYKNSLNHSKSASKLTFENLMLHQQAMASSRSCHNLAANLQTGSSVVERNARIIKWLFNCRKAMTQAHQLQTV